MSYVYPYSFYSIPILSSSATYMYKSYTRKLVKSYIILKLYAIKIIPVELIFTQIMSLSKLKKLAVPLTGLLIFCGKKAKFCGIFRGKFAEKSADFAGFSREKSQNSQKKLPISREISGGNFAKKQSVKNSRFRWIFLANFAKIDQFCVDMTSVV